jgi:hypothetical protein
MADDDKPDRAAVKASQRQKLDWCRAVSAEDSLSRGAKVCGSAGRVEGQTFFNKYVGKPRSSARRRSCRPPGGGPLAGRWRPGGGFGTVVVPT